MKQLFSAYLQGNVKNIYHFHSQQLKLLLPQPLQQQPQAESARAHFKRVMVSIVLRLGLNSQQAVTGEQTCSKNR